MSGLTASKFAQELLSTFNTSIGEIALVPSTGGIFNVTLTFAPPVEIKEAENEDKSADVAKQETAGVRTVLLWDRKAEGGFPETKVLKQRVRDHIEPKKDLGHSDVGGKKSKQPPSKEDSANAPQSGSKLEDCATCP